MSTVDRFARKPHWDWINPVRKLLKPAKDDTCVDFSNNAQKRYASVVVAVASLTFVLVQCDDLGVTHVLWYGAFMPALAEDFVQWEQKGSLAVLE